MNKTLLSVFVLIIICLQGFGQKKYGDPDFVLPAHDSAIVTSGDTGIVKVYKQEQQWMGKIMKAGVVEISTDSTVTQLTIEKAVLTVTANNAARCYGAPDPVFTVSYSGWVKGESESVLISGAKVTADANNTLIPGEAAADNYTFNYVNGRLTVHKLPIGSIKGDNGIVLCGVKAKLPISGNGDYTYTWMKDDSVLTDEKENTIEVNTPGVYKALLTDANGCHNITNSVTMTQVLPPVVDFSFENGCVGNSIYFTNKTQATGPIDYNWHSGNGQSSENTNVSFTYAKASTYTVVLTATPPACPALGGTSMHDVFVATPLASKALRTVAAEPGKPTQLNARKLTNTNYQWAPVTGLSDGNIADPKVTLKTPQTYTIRMAQNNGCITTDTLKVSVANPKAFLVQDEFSPNGDKKNDVLQVYARPIKTIVSFDIFDNTGKQLYQKSKKGEVAWDGTDSKGKKVPEGVYIWIAVGTDYYGKTVREQGTVTLTR